MSLKLILIGLILIVSVILYSAYASVIQKKNKVKEEERTKKYENASNAIEKKKIENLNKAERLAEKTKIDTLQNAIAQKVKDYENSLRNSSG